MLISAGWLPHFICPVAGLPALSRLTVRIRPDDQLLLRERAAARGMAAATYVSVLTRSHLRSLAPLPKVEWLILERILTELGKLGRNINQITRATDRGERVSDPGSTQFRAMLTICNALHANTKKLLLANKAGNKGMRTKSETPRTRTVFRPGHLWTRPS
jgi:hypothetical protein